MKGIIIQVAVLTQYARSERKNGQTITYPLNSQEILKFEKITAPAYIKNELPRQMRIILAKGGFIYGADLYSKPAYTIDSTRTKIQALIRITFEDTNNEGKQQFTRRLIATGLLNSGKIIKQYGTI